MFLRRSLLVALAIVSAAASAAAFAQHKHSHPLRSMHGGEVLEGRRHHFELVLLPAQDPGSVELSLYVTNHHNKAVKLESARAEAVVRSGGAEVRVPLLLAGSNVLKGVGRFEAASGLAVELTVAIGKLPAETLTFRPMDQKKR